MPINNITQTISTIPEAGRRGVDVQTQFVIKQEDFQDHLQGTTVTELNTLKDQLNSRIGEINSTTTTMNGYASTASTGASTATTKAGEASTSASQALTYKNQAGTFATNSSNSATKASQWADNNYNVEVETGKYSAKHWATVAENIVGNTVKLAEDQTIAGVKTFSSSPIVPTPTTGTQAANKGYVDSFLLPIGAILNGYTIFNNCIVAFGGEFNRADYPKLWAYLQTNPALVKTQAQWTTEATANGGMCGYYSSGNGTTTFRVPNLDKAFLRPDSRGVGSFQGDAIRNISGQLLDVTFGVGGSGGGVFSYGYIGQTGGSGGGLNAANVFFNASAVVPTANENRPKNIAVLPLIVAK